MVVQRTSSPASSQAELRVREIALRIGLHDDSEVLQTVCHKMREEYVVELWQLPALDSLQWEKLRAPVGLAVAVQRLSSTTSSSLARSASLASLLRLSHDREQDQEGLRTSSIFRLPRKIGSISDREECDVDDDEAKEDEAVAALLAHLPSELPPLVLHKGEGTGRSNGDEKHQKEKEVTTDSESQLERKDSYCLRQRSQPSMVCDACEVVVNAEAQEEKTEEADDSQRPQAWVARDACDTREVIVNSEAQEEKMEEADDNQRRQPSVAHDAREVVVDSEALEEKTEEVDDNQRPQPPVARDAREVVVNSEAQEEKTEVAENNQWPQPLVAGAALEVVVDSEAQEEKTEVAEYNQRLQPPAAGDAREVVVNSEAQEEKTGEAEDNENRNVPCEERLFVAEDVQIESSGSFSSDVLEMCLADDQPEEQFVNCQTNEFLEMSRVEEQEEESINAGIVDSPTTTATTLAPTPEKPSKNSFSDPGMLEDKKMSSRPDTSSPSVVVSSEESFVSNRDASARIILDSSSSDEEVERFLDVTRNGGTRADGDTRSQSVNGLLFFSLEFTEKNDDDATVVISNVSAEGQASALRRTRSELYSDKAFDEFAETSSFEAETAELQEILKQLPDVDHHSILSQLMIMTNARGNGSRTRLAHQVKDAILASMEKNQIEIPTDKTIHLIFHLAHLNKTYRQLFGKCLFKAMSNLYGKCEKQKGKRQPQSKKKRKRIKTLPPPTIAIQTDEGFGDGSEDDILLPPIMTEISSTEPLVTSSMLATP